MDVYEGWYRIQGRGVRKAVQSLLSDERHLLVVGQTGSGKTTLCKVLAGAWSACGAGGVCILDFNDEYAAEVSVERVVRPQALAYFLMLADPSLPQELLALVSAAGEGGLEQIRMPVAEELYDPRVVRALRLRYEAFSSLRKQNLKYTLPVAKVNQYRMPYAIAILADRLLDKQPELIVLEECQYFEKRTLSLLAAEGRKRGKKVIFITNDLSRISSTVVRNCVIAAFRLLPRDW